MRSSEYVAAVDKDGQSRRKTLLKAALAVQLAETVVNKKPEDLKYKQTLASRYNRLAFVQALNGESGDAAASRTREISIREELVKKKPDAIHYQYSLAASHNNLAWLLATAADLHLRQPEEAVSHAKEAVDLVSDEKTYWNTLGVAQYRNGEWKEATNSLQQSIDLSANGAGTACDSLFLAMAYWQLGQKDEAQDRYNQAIARMKDEQPNDELLRMRAEADMLMGIGTQKPVSPRADQVDADQ